MLRATCARIGLNMAGRRTFLQMKDNNGLEMVWRHLVKTPVVRADLVDYYARTLDNSSLAELRKLHANGQIPQVVLKPMLGDPHQVLLQYALKDGAIEKIDMDGQPIFETCIGDGDVQRIKIVDFTIVEKLAKHLLTALGREDTPQSAKDYLDEMLIGGEELATTIPRPYVPAVETTKNDLNAWATYIEQPVIEEIVVPKDPAALAEIKAYLRPRLMERR